MNVTVLHGSPRRGKNSDTLVQRFLEGLNTSGPHNIEHFILIDLDISPCRGCLNCNTSPHNCAIEDDMQSIYKTYRGSDLIIWASPMYWGYLTAPLKIVQDRMEALACSGFEEKTFVVLLTYNHHYQSAAGMFERIAPHFKIDLHILPCCTFDPETRREIPIEELPEKQEEAYKLGLKLAYI